MREPFDEDYPLDEEGYYIYYEDEGEWEDPPMSTIGAMILMGLAAFIFYGLIALFVMLLN